MALVTQVEIARRVGLDVSTVNKILNGRPGAFFKKETIRKVFKVARELGYDFGRLKHQHRRRHLREEAALPLELCVYTRDGALHDRGTAVARNVSLSGALLSVLVLPQRTLPLGPCQIGIRLLEGPMRDVEILGRPIRFVHEAGQTNLAIEFLGAEEAKARRLVAGRA